MSVTTNLIRLDAEQLESCRANPDEVHEIVAEIIYIDKAGPGIVWLLSRSPSTKQVAKGAKSPSRKSLAALLEGKGAVVEAQMEKPFGLGPPYSLTVQQVQQLSELLQSLNSNELRSNYNPAAMTKVYPWFWKEKLDGFEYLLTNFKMLQSFFLRASRAGQQVLIAFG